MNDLRKRKNRGGKFLMTIVLSLVLIFTTTFTSPFAFASTGASPFTGSTYTHSGQFDDHMVVHGIDVSAWQDSIDWEAAKKAGVDFAIIRIGYRGHGAAGKMQPDNWFVRNIEAAKAAGVMVGVYFFSQALTTLEARAEANYTLELLGDYELDLPIFMDYEYSVVSSGRFTSGTISKIQATSNVKAFCQAIEKSGNRAGLYANLNFLNKAVDGQALSRQYPIWVAQYYTACNYDYEYNHWQYSSGGSVNGISGRADVNFWYFDLEPDKTSDYSLTDCDLYIEDSSSVPYSAGMRYEPRVRAERYGSALTEGVDYKVRYISNTRAGKAYAIVMGKGMYTDYKVLSYNIEPTADLSGITIKKPKDRKYKGVPTIPSYITVTDAAGKKLIENLDYTYTAENAVEVGEADLIVRFIGNYTGTKRVKYNIVAATQSITVTDARTSTNLSAGAYKLGASAKYADAKLTYSSSNPSVASVSSSGKVTPKAAGITTLTISAEATSEYGTATKTIVLTVVDDKKDEPAPTPEPEPEQPSKPDNPGDNTGGSDDDANAAKNARIKTGVERTKVVLLKAPEVSRKRVKLTWKKSNSGYRVDSYQIWRSTKKTSGYTKIFTSTSASHKYYVNTKGLEPGKTYWYKVRGIRRVDGKLVYTPFTKISVTTKK